MPKKEKAEKLLSLQEVAELLRVSERSVFRYIHGGKLKASKIGYWKIKESDLAQFIDNHSNFRGKFMREISANDKPSRCKK